MNTEEYKALKNRVVNMLVEKPFIWNDFSKVLSLVWLHDVKELGHDPRLLTAEGLLNGLWKSKVTDAELVHRIFKELQSINNNHNSNTLDMKNSIEAIPHRIPILAHFKNGNTLTELQSRELFGCSRLASVVNRLNNTPGILINCTIPEGVKYGVYKLFIPENEKVIS